MFYTTILLKYVKNFRKICEKMYEFLAFLFSVLVAVANNDLHQALLHEIGPLVRLVLHAERSLL